VCRVDDLPVVKILDGSTLRQLLGTNMMLNLARDEPHGEAPMHAHAEEQIFVMLDEELEMDLNGDVRTVRRGDIASFHLGPASHERRPRARSQLDISSLCRGRGCWTFYRPR
jgi:uncharacterized cupin superfamily protein